MAWVAAAAAAAAAAEEEEQCRRQQQEQKNRVIESRAEQHKQEEGPWHQRRQQQQEKEDSRRRRRSGVRQQKRQKTQRKTVLVVIGYVLARLRHAAQEREGRGAGECLGSFVRVFFVFVVSNPFFFRFSAYIRTYVHAESPVSFFVLFLRAVFVAFLRLYVLSRFS